MSEQIDFSLNINGVDTTINSVGELNNSLSTLRKQLETTTDKGAFQKLQTEIKKGETQLTSFSKSTKGMKESFIEATEGVKIFGVGFDDVSKLFLKNPIGLIITAVTVAVTALVEIFKTFSPIVDLISDKLAFLKGIFEGVKIVIAQFATGNKDATGSLMDMGRAAENAAKGMREYEDSVASANLKNKQYDAAIEVLIKKSKNKNISLEESANLLEKAAALTEKQIKLNEDLYKQETSALVEKAKSVGATYAQILRIKNGERAADVAGTNEAAKNALEELQNNYAKRNEIQRSYDVLREKIRNAQADVDARREAEELARLKKIDDAKKAFEKDNAERAAEYDRIVKQKKDEEERLEKEAFDQKVRQNAFQLKFMDSLSEKKTKDAEDEKMRMDDVDQRALESFDIQESGVENVSETKGELGKADVVNTASSLNSIATMTEEGTSAWKQIKVAEATIKTTQAAINAYASTAEIPVIGAFLAPLAAAAAIKMGLDQVAMIQQTEIPKARKFEYGGMVSGNRHYAGGTMIEAEQGEAIINRRSMANPILRNLASAINELGGGKTFATPVSSSSNNDITTITNTQKPIKVYVSANEITQTQQRVKVIEQSALY